MKKLENENKIEIRRVYKIITPEAVIEIKRDDPLTRELSTRLMEEDNVEILKDSKISVIPNIKKGKINNRVKRGKRRYIKKKIVRQPEGPDVLTEKKGILPVERINKMLKIEGEFTRTDYQKMLENSGHPISTSIRHTDINDALTLGKIEQIGGKGKETPRRYRVIDATPINKNGLRSLKKLRIEKI